MIEIRELSIKVNVNSESQSERPRQNNGASSNLNKKALIEECLDHVSEMLKNKKER